MLSKDVSSTPPRRSVHITPVFADYRRPLCCCTRTIQAGISTHLKESEVFYHASSILITNLTPSQFSRDAASARRSQYHRRKPRLRRSGCPFARIPPHSRSLYIIILVFHAHYGLQRHAKRVKVSSSILHVGTARRPGRTRY